jgi:hypothetical protein
MHSVNPPGFNIDNAMYVEDVDFQVTNLMNRANPVAINAWGPMLIADREASLSTARHSLERAQVYDTTVRHVRSQINAAIAWETDQETWSIY